ncbi:helix-turn-helix domain-containing protein [Methylocystis parvus]|uniref:helix-turn-helix domain-containing protein n=1 Tax=Methylocystis parvus TaxID=134 RepID=UPI003C776BF1
MLDWSQQHLAEAAKIGNATIRNFEGGKSEPQSATLDVLKRALETAGVEFIPENGGGPGVRLRKAAAR